MQKTRFNYFTLSFSWRLPLKRCRSVEAFYVHSIHRSPAINRAIFKNILWTSEEDQLFETYQRGQNVSTLLSRGPCENPNESTHAWRFQHLCYVWAKISAP